MDFNRFSIGVQVDSNAPPMRVLLDSAWMQSGLNWEPMGVWLDANPVLVGFLCDSNVVPMAPNRIPRGFQLHP